MGDSLSVSICDYFKEEVGTEYERVPKAEEVGKEELDVFSKRGRSLTQITTQTRVHVTQLGEPP